MKSVTYLLVFFLLIGMISCDTMNGDTPAVNTDSLRADSVWKARIADSINRERGLATDPSTSTVPDTGFIGVETITKGMKEGLDKVQDGLDKMKRVTEVSSNSAKEISDGIKKTSDAIHKTVDNAKKTINGDK